MSPLGKSAMAYALKFKWRVFPLRKGGKEPLGSQAPHGVDDATTDAGRVRAWWEAAPNANVGLACGSQFFVLDVDPRSGGDETLGRLEREHGQLPTTPRALTGGGGYHILFAMPPDQKLKGSLGEGLDVKGPGGYIVAPPSVHPSGKTYDWELGAHPAELQIAQAPEWMGRMLFKRPSSAGPAIGAAAQSFLARCFDVAGWLGATVDAERVMARCPWSHEHSTDRQGNRTGEGADTSCVILAPTAEKTLGIFQCSHGHCKAAGRGNIAALLVLPTQAVLLVGRTMRAELDIAIWVVAEHVS